MSVRLASLKRNSKAPNVESLSRLHNLFKPRSMGQAPAVHQRCRNSEEACLGDIMRRSYLMDSCGFFISRNSDSYTWLDSARQAVAESMDVLFFNLLFSCRWHTAERLPESRATQRDQQPRMQSSSLHAIQAGKLPQRTASDGRILCFQPPSPCYEGLRLCWGRLLFRTEK